MASNHTANYNLSQWEENDEVLRVDFNADNAAIDAGMAALDGKITAEKAALEGKLAAAKTALEGQITAAQAAANAAYGPENAPCVCGYYTGNGASEGLAIELGFAPSAVFSVYLGARFVVTGSVGSSNTSGLSVRGGPLTAAALTDTGFIAKGYLNTSGSQSSYVAWR